MTNIFSTARRVFLAAAAFGLATTALAGAARADSGATASATLRVGTDAQHYRAPAERGRYDRPHVRPVRPITVDAHVRALSRYDQNHNRRIDLSERKPYWSYLLSTGAYGQLTSDETSRFIQLIGYYDLNADGRLLGSERAGMDRLIDSLRLHRQLDRNNDKVLSRYEIGFSAFAPRFFFIDKNNDRLLSQQEVRDEALRAFRDGEC